MTESAEIATVADALHREQDGVPMRDCPYPSCHFKYDRLARAALAALHRLEVTDAK